MSVSIQKASIWKRASAFILDAIIAVILMTGVAFGVSSVTNYDKYQTTYTQKLEAYETQYGVELGSVSSQEELDAKNEEFKKAWEECYNALINDDEAMHAYAMTKSLTLVIASTSVISSFLIVEFVLPLILKDGQTVGKKIFGIAVVKNNCVKANHIQHFVRSMLGKCTLETMVPVLIFYMLFFNMVGIIGLVILGAIIVLQIVLVIATKNNCLVHDILAGTVVVDKASQRMFDTEADLLEYEKQEARNEANLKSY